MELIYNGVTLGTVQFKDTAGRNYIKLAFDLLPEVRIVRLDDDEDKIQASRMKARDCKDIK